MSSLQRTMSLMLLSKRLMVSVSSCSGRKFTTETASTSTPQLTFENLLCDENKLRAQQKLKSVIPARTTKEYPLKPEYSFAAVLVPLCLVNGEPSLLLTLRSTRLKKHRGQVSFPGGNVDAEDADFIHTALRETDEELGMKPSCFDIWGQMNPLPGSEGWKAVYPILARTGEVDVSKLRINRQEVEEAFSVPLRHLCHHNNIGVTRFREGAGYTLPVYMGTPHRIWGLTAVIVHQMLMIVAPGLYKFKVIHKRTVHHSSSHGDSRDGRHHSHLKKKS